MQLDDVRDQLRELAARVPAGTTDLDDAFTRTRRTVKKQRLGRGVMLLVVLALLGTLAVVIDASRPSRGHLTVVAPTTTAPPKLPFTEEQLAAHRGVGVPRGWAPVDVGDARRVGASELAY